MSVYDELLHQLRVAEESASLPDAIGLAQAVMNQITLKLNHLHGRADLYGLDKYDKDTLAAQGQALQQVGVALEKLSKKGLP